MVKNKQKGSNMSSNTQVQDGISFKGYLLADDLVSDKVTSNKVVKDGEYSKVSDNTNILIKGKNIKLTSRSIHSSRGTCERLKVSKVMQEFNNKSTLEKASVLRKYTTLQLQVLALDTGVFEEVPRYLQKIELMHSLIKVID